MTVDCPLTCYICGETTDNATVDMIGCLENQADATVRFREKFNREPDSYLWVCEVCYKVSKPIAKNVEKKYGVIV